jgi:hypothetical protein
LSTDFEFKTRISKLRRLIVRKSIAKILRATLLLALIFNTVALGLQKTGVFQWEGYAVYPLLLLISFAFSTLYHLHRKKSFKETLIDIDIRLDLKERLTTVYEYHQLGKRSLFMDRLKKESISLLGTLRGKQIFPRHFTIVHLLIPVFTIMFILVLTVDLSPRASKQERATTERLRQIGIELEKYAKRARPEKAEAKKQTKKELVEQMKAIARALQEGSMKEKRLLKSLDGIMNRSESERKRLTRRLREELGLGDISSIPGVQDLQKDKPNPTELARLKKELKDLFGGEVPPSISQDISNLALHHEIAQFLKGTMEDVGSKFKEETTQELSASMSRPPGRTEDRPEAAEDRPAGDEESLSTAGRGKAEVEKQAPYDLVRLKRPALKDKGVSGRGDRYNTSVRSLPAIGRARLKEEEIIRAYQKEFESVLRKEDIPLLYREYVKQYFLSIGIGKEPEGNGDTQ